MRKRTQIDNVEYRKLIAKIDKVIKNNPITHDNQGSYVNKLIKDERDLQLKINSLPISDTIYKEFSDKVTIEMGNILRAKPYFRAKEKLFNSEISKIFKKQDHLSLKGYDGNYLLISFLVERLNHHKPKIKDQTILKKIQIINSLFDSYCDLRSKLIESNLALVVNRAIQFFNKTSSNSITVIDFINIATQGLSIAVDKYVGEYTKVFRSVCIGAMTRMMIENNTASLTKLPSGDKRILYRVNIYRFRKGVTDIEELTRQINESYKKDKSEGKIVPKLPILKEKILSLIESVDNQEKENIGKEDIGTDSESCYYDMESEIEKNDLKKSLISACKSLSIMESKVLRLKGVSL